MLLHLLTREAADGSFCVWAMHVNHGISPFASDWEQHCVRVCRESGLELRVARVHVVRGPGESLEEQARIARYRAFEEADAYAMALAHHAEDQAETVLLQMLRGAGPKGLAGMGEFAVAVDRPATWRPMLDTPRAEIAEYARAVGLHWVEDDSNSDTGMRRNYLRHRVWPALAQGFPAPARMIARVATLQADAAALLDELADADLAVLEAGGSLDCIMMRDFSASRQANLLRRWIARHGVRAPSAKRLEALLKALADSSNDTRLAWMHEGLCIRRRGSRLIAQLPGESGPT